MIAIQIVDFFILKADRGDKAFSGRNLIIWFVGFVLYRMLMSVDIIVGNTLPDMLLTMALCMVVDRVAGRRRRLDQA